jgi:hypothetical protein
MSQMAARTVVYRSDATNGSSCGQTSRGRSRHLRRHIAIYRRGRIGCCLPATAIPLSNGQAVHCTFRSHVISLPTTREAQHVDFSPSSTCSVPWALARDYFRSSGSCWFPWSLHTHLHAARLSAAIGRDSASCASEWRPLFPAETTYRALFEVKPATGQHSLHPSLPLPADLNQSIQHDLGPSLNFTDSSSSTLTCCQLFTASLYLHSFPIRNHGFVLLRGMLLCYVYTFQTARLEPLSPSTVCPTDGHDGQRQYRH